MIYFLLPAYNEKDSISIQLNAIRDIAQRNNYPYTVMVVDDGSSDDTRKIVRNFAREMPLVLLEHPQNKGVGEAFKTGFREVLKLIKDEDIVITMDADNTQDLASSKLMVKRIGEGYEVAVGSLFAPGGLAVGVPWLRAVLSWGCNKLYQICFPIRGIREYTGFYRAYSAFALKSAFSKFGDSLLESNGFAVMAEMLIKLRRIPLLMTEVPMIVRYDFKKGSSKIKIAPTIREHIRIISKNLFCRDVI